MQRQGHTFFRQKGMPKQQYANSIFLAFGEWTDQIGYEAHVNSRCNNMSETKRTLQGANLNRVTLFTSLID
jgi:hypothetical protein